MSAVVIIIIIVLLLVGYYYYYQQNNGVPTGPNMSYVGKSSSVGSCRMVGVQQFCDNCPLGSGVDGTGQVTSIYLGTGQCKCNDFTRYWDENSKTCKTCPVKAVSNGLGDATNVEKCKCPDLKTWYWETDRCKECPAGSTLTGTGTPIDETNNKCKCTDPSYYWNKVSKTCTLCPPNSSTSNRGDSAAPNPAGLEQCKCGSGCGDHWSKGFTKCLSCPAGSCKSSLPTGRGGDLGFVTGGIWDGVGPDDSPIRSCRCVFNGLWNSSTGSCY